MTAQEVIEAAYQELGILVAGGSPSTNDLIWALGKLNRMLKSWSADGINLHPRTEESFSLVAGTASYTIGSGGVFNTIRPNIIDKAFICVDNHDYALGVRPISEYWSLSEKSTQDRPIKLYYDPTYPLGTVYFYYIPDNSYSLYLVSQKPFTVYLSAATDVSLPYEYEDAVVLNLATRIASRYGKAISNDLRVDARNALGNLRALNLGNYMEGAELDLPRAQAGNYNVDADY